MVPASVGGFELAYNVPYVQRLTGLLDVEALVAAVSDVVSRHESLRTVYPEVDGNPVQRVVPVGDAKPVFVVEGVEAGGLGERLNEAVAYRFALDSEIPSRATLFRVSPTEHVLALVLHHIAVMVRLWVRWLRLGAAYAARCGGGVPEWAPLPVQYVDYALWQRELLVISMTGTVWGSVSWRSGRMRWRGCRMRSGCRSTVRARRWRPTVVGPSISRWVPMCTQDLWLWRVVPVRPRSWCSMRRCRCCWRS